MHARAARGYAVALAALAAAALLSVAFSHFSPLRIVIGFLFLCAILVSAWWGGYIPGAIAVLATAYGAPYIVNANFSPRQIHPGQVLLLILVSILVSRLSVATQGMLQKLRTTNQWLEDRVRERTAELERLNEALREQADHLARANADLLHFSDLAAHDFQEPLRIIHAYSDLLMKRYGRTLDPDAREFFTILMDQSTRLRNLVSAVLNYSRIGQKPPPSLEPVDLSRELQLVLARFDSEIRASGATIDYDPLPCLAGERTQISELFRALIANALIYKGANPPRIAVRARQERGQWIISVEDQGIGIHPDYHQKVFAPFQRLHGSEYTGAGIGLAICRRIVERHGGRIWVESEPGRGAAFRFTLSPEPAPQPVEAAATAAR